MLISYYLDIVISGDLRQVATQCPLKASERNIAEYSQCVERVLSGRVPLEWFSAESQRQIKLAHGGRRLACLKFAFVMPPAVPLKGNVQPEFASNRGGICETDVGADPSIQATQPTRSLSKLLNARSGGVWKECPSCAVPDLIRPSPCPNSPDR